MKKLFLSLSVIALLTACGNSANGNSSANDSIATDSVKTEAPTATVDLHTEEAIKEQVIAYYDELNKVNDGVLNMTSLDSMACTQELLSLMQQVDAKNQKAIEQGSDAYFEDEGFRWFQGLGTPIKVQFDNITDPTQDYVEAFLTLSWKDQTGQVRLRLKMEDGQWKINDFGDYDFDGSGFRTDLESFLGLNADDIAS